jgi:hypothetical protein
MLAHPPHQSRESSPRLPTLPVPSPDHP